MKYNAFISYSHSQDHLLAPGLEKALEKFAKPTFKRRALHIFRDANDLALSPDLWGKIEEGLSQSEYFIYFASPASANSHYCNLEVKYWLENKPMDNFLIAVTDGELHWDFKRSDYDWSRTTALPDLLKGKFKNEPFYIDFREPIPPENLNLDNPDFKSKVVLLSATIHGKAVGDMVGEAVKQHKRTLRYRNSAIATVFSLMTLALVLMVSSARKKSASVLHFQALNTLERDATLALRLEEEAIRLHDNEDYRKSAADIYKNYPYYINLQKSVPDSSSAIAGNKNLSYWELQPLFGDLIDAHTNLVPPLQYSGILSPDSTALFLYQQYDFGRQSGYAGVLNLEDLNYKLCYEFTDMSRDITHVTFTPNEQNILVMIRNGDMEMLDKEGNKLYDFKGHREAISSVVFSKNGKTILTGSIDGTARLWDLEGNTLKVFSNQLAYDAWQYAKKVDEWGGVPDFQARFTENDQQIVTTLKTFSTDSLASEEYSLSEFLWDWNKGLLAEINSEAEINFDGVMTRPGIVSATFSPDGRQVLLGLDSGSAVLFDSEGNKIQDFLRDEAALDENLTACFSPNGQSIFLTSWNTFHHVLQYDGSSYKTLFKDNPTDGFYTEHTAFLSDDRILMITGNLIVVKDLEGNVIKQLETTFGIRSFDISSDASKIIMGGWEGLYLYDLTKDEIQDLNTPLASLDNRASAFNAVAFSPNDDQFLSGSTDYIMRLHNLDGSIVREYKGNLEDLTMEPEHEGIRAVDFSPDGSKVLAGSDYLSQSSGSGSVLLWNLEGELLHAFSEVKDEIGAVSFSPDGNKVLIQPSTTYSSYGPSEAKSVYIFDARFESLANFLNSKALEELSPDQKQRFEID